MTAYWVGKKWGHAIYRDDVLIGVMDDPADAALVVGALNGRDVVPRVRVYSEPVGRGVRWWARCDSCQWLWISWWHERAVGFADAHARTDHRAVS